MERDVLDGGVISFKPPGIASTTRVDWVLGILSEESIAGE